MSLLAFSTGTFNINKNHLKRLIVITAHRDDDDNDDDGACHK